MNRISFIIPFYNSAKYIEKCLDSLYQQNISEENYEVICVNDCSPDNTRDIVLKYQKIHQNLVLIEHAINKGQGEARNFGLSVAKGKYIWYIDSDDYIEEQCLKDLLELVENENLDVLNFWICRDNNTQKILVEHIAQTSEVMNGSVWLKNLRKNFDENAYCVTKIFKASFLTDNNILFVGRLFEDQSYCLFSVYNAKGFKHIDRNIYYYRFNQQSTLNQRFRPLHYISSIECGSDYLLFYNQIKGNDPEFAKKVKMSGLWKINFGCSELPYFSHSYRKRLIESLKPHLLLIKRSGYFNGVFKYYFQYFSFFNVFLFILSPILKRLRKIKRTIKKVRKLFKK